MTGSHLISELLIDHVVELLGRKYRKSQIKLELAEMNDGVEFDFRVVDKVIRHARQKIRDIYHIDPIEYKGGSIECYSSIIRDPQASNKDRINAQENIDKLLGLEHLATDDPVIYAEKVVEALRAMDGTIEGKEPDESSQKQSPQSETKGDPFEDIHDDDLEKALENIQLGSDGSLKSK